MRQTQRHAQIKTPALTIYRCEADVAEGLEEVAHDEIGALGKRVRLPSASTSLSPGVVRFSAVGDVRALLRLQTIQAVYLVQAFPVPRPKALLSNEFFFPLLEMITLVRSLRDPAAFTTLELSAAGSDSAVMTRLTDEIARRSGLTRVPERGDLLLRVRRATDGSEGWEVLVRLSPRPLSARSWRVCNMEGALNAPIAHAMARLGQPNGADTYLNIACGSGTLLVERLRCAPARRAMGCDTAPAALTCARENLAAGGFEGAVELHAWDARALALPDGSVDALSADLPFGHLVGSHELNLELYPAILAEAARVARPGAAFVLLTHEVRLTEALLADSAAWELERVLRVRQGGLYPRIFVLRRR